MKLSIKAYKVIMDDDYFQKNNKLFIIGLISLVMALAFLGITLYMLPNLLFGWRYNTPAFFMIWREWLQTQYGYTQAGASKIVLLLFFIPTTVFIVISYFSSRRIDSQTLYSDLSSEIKFSQVRKQSREGVYLALKILFIMIFVFIVASLLQWLIYYL